MAGLIMFLSKAGYLQTRSYFARVNCDVGASYQYVPFRIEQDLDARKLRIKPEDMAEKLLPGVSA